MSEGFIKKARTDRYNIMCSIISHNKQQPKYVDDDISSGGRQITNNKTPEAL